VSWSERVRRLGELIGRPVVDEAVPFVEYATVDSIRHFARAYGDGNPLYSDPAYASAGPWKGLVAPPLWPIASGVCLPSASAIDLGACLGPDGGEPIVVADRWILHRPIVSGTRLERSTELLRVDTEPVDVTIRRRYLADGIMYATQDRTRRYGPRPAPAPPPERAAYSSEALASIDLAYDRHGRRGGAPRWVEDVNVGDRLGPMVKGPLTITDLVEYRSGVGPGPLGAAALDLARGHRAERPALYSLDPSNVPDTVERRHWDEDYARSLGHPTVYDYSHTRLTWFSHLVTDWMGDGGWLMELSASTPGMNYLGDTHWLSGAVVAVGEGSVGIDLQGANQRQEVTCSAQAIVLLPRRPEDVARLIAS
jgi:acyl dehydratase